VASLYQNRSIAASQKAGRGTIASLRSCIAASYIAGIVASHRCIVYRCIGIAASASASQSYSGVTHRGIGIAYRWHRGTLGIAYRIIGIAASNASPHASPAVASQVTRIGIGIADIGISIAASLASAHRIA
jgi:hypothetical protein